MEELQLKEQIDLYNSAFPKLEYAFIYQIAFCHLCKKRAVVFCCYKNFKAASCTKKYCAQCLRNYYDDNIENVLSKTREWNCPYKQNACCCSKCGSNASNYRSLRENKIPALKEQIKESYQNNSSDENIIQQNKDQSSDSQSEYSQSSSDSDEDLNINVNSLISDSEKSETENIRVEEKPVFYNQQKLEQKNYREDISSVNIKTIKTPFIKQVKERIRSIQNLDTIQSGLEYNNYLIQNLIEKQNELTEEEKDYMVQQLFLNLKKLGMSADYSLKEGKIVNENRLNKIAFDPKIQGEIYNITDKEKLLQFLDQELKINFNRKDQHIQYSSQNSTNSKKQGKQLIVSPIKRQETLLQKRANSHILQIQGNNVRKNSELEIEGLEIDENFNIIISKSIINYQ